MSTLTNMKISKAEREARYKPSSIATEGPLYPWGLSINLDNDALEKLGFDELPKVGKTLTLIARVDVTSVSESESAGGGENKSLGLQITDMCLETGDEAADAAKTLYK